MILTVTLNTSVDKFYRVDRLHPYEVMRVKEVNNTAGGKGLNVSRVAALSGEQVTAMGFVGGCNGELFKSLISGENITPAFTQIKAETRCCVNVFDGEAKKSTELLEPGSPVTEEERHRFLEEYRRRLPDAEVVAISGSMPKGIPVDFYASLIEIARKQGKQVILDTNGQALQSALPAGPAWIKPNADEIRQITNADVGSFDSVIAAAKQLQQGGVANVAVSLGKDGVAVVCGSGVYRGITPDIPVVNTVGCGDSMVAGFAVGTVRGYSVEEIIRYAVAVSTANALTRETGSFRAEDLERILPQVKVVRLEK